MISSDFVFAWLSLSRSEWGIGAFLRMNLVEKESDNNNNENHNSYADDEFRGSQARELRAGLDPLKAICFLLFD